MSQLPLPPSPLAAAFAAARTELRVVGGAVRDALLGRAAHDLDLATPANPDRIIAILGEAAIPVVLTGIEHGTVTAIVAGVGYEITTLRRDVKTDGRHAVVAFDADWRDDAARRDFTFNAMSVTATAQIYDPFRGAEDLAKGRVRFVGDAAKRIAEDALRVLRYYRFEARFGAGDGDPQARAACRAAVPMLAALSIERVATELLKLLDEGGHRRAIAMMRADGVLAAVLPEATQDDLPVSGPALRQLAALIGPDLQQISRVAGRLRLSNTAKSRLAAMAERFAANSTPLALRQALDRLGPESYADVAALSGIDHMPEAIPLFPLRGEDALAYGKGQRVGTLLATVREWWAATDFTADRSACLVRLAMVARGALHFVGFRGDEYHSAVNAFGLPDFYHRGWDHRANREIADGDTVIFSRFAGLEPSERSFDDSNQDDDPAAKERGHKRETSHTGLWISPAGDTIICIKR